MLVPFLFSIDTTLHMGAKNRTYVVQRHPSIYSKEEKNLLLLVCRESNDSRRSVIFASYAIRFSSAQQSGVTMGEMHRTDNPRRHFY